MARLGEEELWASPALRASSWSLLAQVRGSMAAEEVRSPDTIGER